jgi:inosine-uridine nucleoside N-ribohydrolase
MRVWIDTDVALGATSGDVDDGFALAALLRCPSVEILGISTVFGNTTPEVAARCARALTGMDVVAGAARPGQLTAAADAIAALPPGATILALGPLTNLLRAPPHVEVRLVGGNLASWGVWPPLWPFEFNLAKDAGAARAFFDSHIRRRIYPLDACRHLTADLAALRRLQRSPDPLAQKLARGSWRWLTYAPLRYRALRFPVWDLVPALDVCGLLEARFELRRLRLEGRGLLVADAAAPEALCLRQFAAAWPAFERLFTPPGSESPAR